MTTTTTPAASPGTAAEVHQPPPGGQLAAYLAAVAARLAARGITSTLEPIAGTPVLTAEEPDDDITTDPDDLTAVSLTPGTDPAVPVECTCIWTPAPFTSPETTADTIAAVLAATRPPQMKDSRPSPRDLTALIFQGLYPRYELATVAGIHIVTPRGTPWFAGPSLGTIARTISDYEYQGTLLRELADTDTGPGTAHPAPGPAA